MGKFIVITGFDGSGTTTIAKELHKLDKESFFIQSPDDLFSASRSIIDTEVKKISEVAHYYFYLSNNILISEKIKKIKKQYPKSNIYCTRYFMDTVVSHKVQNVNAKLEYNNGIYDIEKPDFTFFLKLNEDSRQKRLKERGSQKSKLDKVLDCENIRDKFMSEFLKFKDLIFLDASKSIIEICQEIKLKMENNAR